MKNKKYDLFPGFIAGILIIICLLSNAKAYSQEGAYWQGLSIKNPAAIGTPSDWVFGSYHFSNLGKLTKSDKNYLTGFIAGADYKIAPKLGTVGINYTREEMELEVLSLMEINYAYSVPVAKGVLNLGISAGRKNYKDELSYHLPYEYSPYGYSPYGYSPYGYGYGSYEYNYNGYEITEPGLEDLEISFVKTGIGLFYNSTKFDLGISTIRYIELDNNQENEQYSIDYTSNFFTALGAYRFNFAGKMVIEPNLMVDFFENKTDVYPGIFFEYKNMFWAGYSSLNLNDLHSLMLGANIIGRFRLGYSYNFVSLFSNSSLNIHEFMLGIRLNRPPFSL